MKIIPNENILDRLARVILAEILFIIALFWFSGTGQVVFYVMAAAILITAGTGFCGLYKVLGINTEKQDNKKVSKVVLGLFIVIFVVIAVAGSYYSNFFTKKFFLEDYNRMNNYYKQTLFYTGQDKRVEALDNYTKLVSEFTLFNNKYQKFHPYVLKKDSQFNADLVKVSDIITGLEEDVKDGDLQEAHINFEQVRPIFQDILKRNGFSMLAVSLVDFHDAMEEIIAKADAKDLAGVINVYPGVSDKLKAVEAEANDSEIQAIRARLEEVLVLAKTGNADSLSAKAAELKSAFVKVYLKRG